MPKIKNARTQYTGILFSILLCTFAYGSNKIYGFTFFPDEFGYWSSAAGILGLDWSELTQNMPYYSFGYSLILTPIYWLSQNGLEAYRVAVFINMLLLCASSLLLVRIVRYLFSEEKEILHYIATAVAVLYPGWMLYMQTTMVEILLVFGYLLVSFYLMRFLSDAKMQSAIGLGLSLTYLFWIHMRSIGVVIAGCLVILLWMIKEKKQNKNVIFFFLALILFMAIGYLTKSIVIETIYSKTNQDLLNANDFAGQVTKLGRMFSWNEIKSFFLECVAKAFYLILATFGMIYWGMKHSIRTTIPQFLNKNTTAKEYMKLFFVLSMLAQFAIGAIFMHGGSRIDTIVYGRYMEFVIPPLMAIGVMELARSRKIIRESILLCGVTCLGVPAIHSLIETRNLKGIVSPFMLGITYVLKEYNLSEHVLNQKTFFWQAYLFGAVTILIGAALFWTFQKIWHGYYVLTLLLLLEVTGGIYLSEKYTYSYNAGYKMDQELYETTLLDAGEGAEVYYLSEGEETVIMMLQLFQKEETIHVVSLEEWRTEQFQEDLSDHILIIDYYSPNREQISKEYSNEGFSTSFLMYYK